MCSHYQKKTVKKILHDPHCLARFFFLFFFFCLPCSGSKKLTCAVLYTTCNKCNVNSEQTQLFWVHKSERFPHIEALVQCTFSLTRHSHLCSPCEEGSYYNGWLPERLRRVCGKTWEWKEDLSLKGSHLLMWTDNTMVIFYINCQWGK